MNDLLTRLWRLGKPFQWRFLWLATLGPDGRLRACPLKTESSSRAVAMGPRTVTVLRAPTTAGRPGGSASRASMRKSGPSLPRVLVEITV